MPYVCIISRTLCSKGPSPVTAAPVIGNSACAGETGGAVVSPPQEIRTARQAMGIVRTLVIRPPFPVIFIVASKKRTLALVSGSGAQLSSFYPSHPLPASDFLEDSY